MAWNTANDIKNLALMELNHATITDWADINNTDVPIVNAQHELAKPVALSRYQWSFARKMAKMTLTALESDSIAWKYAVNLPTDALCDIAVYSTADKRMLIDWEVVGKTLYTNEETVYVEYTYEAPENVWTPEFVDWYKTFLAERLNGYLNGDMQREQLLQSKEPVLFRTAKNIDSKRNKHESLSTNPMLLVRGRFGLH